MNRLLSLATLFLASLVIGHWSFSAQPSSTDPLRVYIRSGPKTHGPGMHDHPRFLADWVTLLSDRGARATGGDTAATSPARTVPIWRPIFLAAAAS